MNLSKTALLLGGLLAAATLAPAAALGQVKPNATAADVGLYTGPDRMQKLIEGAKKEQTLSVYTSAPVDDYAAFSAAFEKKYPGVRIQVWRAGSEKVLQRGVTEARAGRYDVDIFDTNGPELESLHREKILQAVRSPHTADLIPQAVQPHGEWVGTRLNIFAFAYNTNRVKKDEVPKRYEDLLDPRWKGRLGIEAGDFDWFSGVAGTLGEDRAVKLFHDIVAKNGISVRKGHTLLTNLVAAGEVPLSLTVYNYKAEQLKRKGAPIDWFVIPPAIARPNGIGMTARAPHPHAAMLFYDWMLSDGQALLLKRQFVPVSTKVKTNLSGFAVKFIESKVILDETDKWEKLFENIIGTRSK
ncbi:MAG: extracellular solute-binding protein [Burkholderiales bacterium]